MLLNSADAVYHQETSRERVVDIFIFEADLNLEAG